MSQLLNKEEVSLILEVGLAKVGQKYEKGFNCETFVRTVYKESGLICDYRSQPFLTLEDLFKDEFIGYLCFLKHKLHGQHRRFTHVGIIFPERCLLHYSRYFGEPNIREVFLTPFEKIFEVYNFPESIAFQ